MTAFLAALHSIKIKFDLGSDDDTADKLSCRYSVAILLLFCVVISTKQYVGDPIDCWVPGTFSGPMRDYTDNICWIKNTYYVQLLPGTSLQVIPFDPQVVKDNELNYYQWVPIVLSIQAFMFYFPCMVWKVLNGQTGCDLKHIVEMFGHSSIINTETREKSIEFASIHVDKFLLTRKTPGKQQCASIPGGYYIVSVYLFIKLLYLTNCVGQLFLLNEFVGQDYAVYGVEVMTNLFTDKTIQESRRFPRTTLCSFRVWQLGSNVHRHTVQCVLPVNLFNEKIYIFLWFWLFFVALVTIYSLVAWIWTFLGHSRIEYCKRYLKQFPTYNYSKADKRMIASFANDYLRQDGVFILQMLERNVNGVILCEIVMSLFENFRKRWKHRSDELDIGEV